MTLDGSLLRSSAGAARTIRSFISDHKRWSRTFDPRLASTRDHAAALSDLETAFKAAYNSGDRVLSDQDLAAMYTGMENVTGAAVDARVDDELGFDPGTYDPRNARSATEIVRRGNEAETETPDVDADFGAGDREIRRAADGRIVYDGAPEFSAIRAGDAKLGLGHKSDEVRDVQRALFEGGHYDGLYADDTDVDAVADNFYGPKTTEAVRRWQRANGLEETGELNGAQLDALINGTSVDNTIRDSRDRVVADDVATAKWAYDTEETRIIDDNTHVTSGTYVGAEVSGKWDGWDVAAGAKVGAFTGTTVTESRELDIGGWFGINASGTAGVGVGAKTEGHVALEDGRLSIGGESTVGAGLALGLGGSVWIDFNKIGQDLWSLLPDW